MVFMNKFYVVMPNINKIGVGLIELCFVVLYKLTLHQQQVYYIFYIYYLNHQQFALNHINYI